ncbi:MAG TPA: ribosomal protein S18-alanine N-acetyltransferase [Salinisphaeraceae bacterium]|nr:ribosomal protein S18-alanine N-acetyltransferase [Salinisphaeraceae bacterium]
MSAQPQNLFRIRPMQPADLVAVARNDKASYPFPWSKRIFRDCLRVGYRCFVATDLSAAVVGHALLSIAFDEAHVLNICVAPAYRRQGIARQLLDQLLQEADAANARNLLLEVRPSNRAARRLYAAYGFRRIAKRPDYYPAKHGREDAYLLSRRVQPFSE